VTDGVSSVVNKRFTFYDLCSLHVCDDHDALTLYGNDFYNRFW